MYLSANNIFDKMVVILTPFRRPSTKVNQQARCVLVVAGRQTPLAIIAQPGRSSRHQKIYAECAVNLLSDNVVPKLARRIVGFLDEGVTQILILSSGGGAAPGTTPS